MHSGWRSSTVDTYGVVKRGGIAGGDGEGECGGGAGGVAVSVSGGGGMTSAPEMRRTLTELDFLLNLYAEL
jgi:hypothetical protein